MNKLRIVAAVLALALPLKAGAVEIAPVGTTDVTVDSGVLAFLAGAGITPSPIAPATLDTATFAFPIIGGETDTLTIAHRGGVRLEAGSAFIEVSDFVINGSDGDITGMVFGSDPAFASPSSATLFDLADVVVGTPITATLLFSDTLNSALGLTFLGSADALALTGTVFGTATTSPTAVPLSAKALLVLGGLGALAGLRRRA